VDPDYVDSGQRISVAVGIVMRDQDVDVDQAFAHLRRAGQDSNRTLRSEGDRSAVYAYGGRA
jgi:hypothetical protein